METIRLNPAITHNHPSTTPMVLVCEGEDIIRKLLIRYIEQATHWEVHGASDGHQAEQYLNIRSYDMVVSSLFLDFKSGFELLHDVRKQLEQDIPVIIMSSDPAEDTVIQAFEMGADDVVDKPIHMKELVARMKYHLSKYQAINSSWKAHY